METCFQRIILYARQYRAKQNQAEIIGRLLHFLSQCKVEVFVHEDAAPYLHLQLPTLASSALRADSDLIVVIGGDGSLLSAARMAIIADVPVVGIHRGRLGFLTDISPEQMESQLQDILQGKYQEERRLLLHIQIRDQKKVYFETNALNDIVLSRGSDPHLIDFHIWVNQHYVSHYRADGMVIATPTGSTAYALSAGGPILHPTLNAITLVPLCPHRLSSRPLVIDADSVIKVEPCISNEHPLSLSCDSHETHVVGPEHWVQLTKQSRLLRLLHPLEYRYYDTLRMKLGWESGEHAC
ncbi:MAG: NAD(+) kinase [Legionellaceae bacterium]|nr:NAD(+) kinase [Legionellaceae bacterium]